MLPISFMLSSSARSLHLIPFETALDFNFVFIGEAEERIFLTLLSIVELLLPLDILVSKERVSLREASTRLSKFSLDCNV